LTADFGIVVATLGYIITQMPETGETETLLADMLRLCESYENKLKPFYPGYI